MKKDTQQRRGVSQSSAPVTPIGEPQNASSNASRQVHTAGNSSVEVTISTKYIDSRLKQFCLR